MAGYRYDELTASWVVIAPARRGLPIDARVMAREEIAAASAPTATPAASPLPDEPGARPCPFCPGSESETEATVAQSTGADGAWRVRVVRNRYPTVTPDADLAAPTPGGRELPAWGLHEVIVETREHDRDLDGFAPGHLAEVVRMYRDRQRALEAEPGVAAVTVFRNRGRRAGSSQSHPHAQAIATGVLPAALDRRAAIARAHAHSEGRSLLAELVARELALEARVVGATEAFVVLCPFAPHRAYETWIVPRRTGATSFAALDDELLAPLAAALADAVRRVRAVTRDAAYNLIVRTPPVGHAADAPGWHLELLPRTGGDAGFELGTGMDVVPVAPELAAAELRAVGEPAAHG